MSLANASVPSARLEALQSRHAALESQLSEQRHSSSPELIRDLKRRKLMLKEEIEGIRAS